MSEAGSGRGDGGSGTACLVERLLGGDRRALARLLTLVEDGSEPRLRDVAARLHRHTGDAHLVGITGSPGVGKSTLTSALTGALRRQDRTVGVVAVDPSSPFTGGALLGDRVRMQDHVLDAGVFIRSMASRGHLGGISWATPQALAVMDAAGFDTVMVETVGVGQAEVEIAALAETTVVVLAPGMGDAIQAAKAGILEIADVFCVNKADREGADRTVRELKGMLELGHGEWLPPVVKTVAPGGEGVDALAEALARHRAWLAEHDRLGDQRRRWARLQIREIALRAVRRRFAAIDDGALVEDLVARVAGRELDPYAAADELLDRLA